MHILSTLKNTVLTLTLNRPDKLNAFTFAMVAELAEAVEAAQRSAEVRVIVLTGAGRGFCAGQDLGAASVPDSVQDTLEQTYNRLVRAMAQGGTPVLAAVNGIAAGAGANVALAADIRLWSSAARFTQAFSSIALIPDAGGTWSLPRAVGYHKAFELAALPETLDAQTGLALGLCEQVFPAETFGQEVQAYAERLAARPAEALARTKHAMRRGLTLRLEESLALEAEVQAQAFADPDHSEGIAAFLEKRPARFKP